MFVLSTITCENFDFTIISFDWNLESKNIIASHNVLEHILINISLLSSFINKHLNLFQESWFFDCHILGHTWLEIDWCIGVDTCDFLNGSVTDCIGW